ncbi:MAG: RagB/SusD family nutrient uptake outer membrane protein [Bacteroidetes bacterium]|nr:MAG: RagB/SusD family nutrient uptake outer membrane protein [Bacteroidota bacterium]
MKSNKNVILFLSLLMFLGLGCSKDFLNKTSLSQIAEASFWKDERDAQLAVNGIYDALQNRVIYSGTLNNFRAAAFPIFDALGDNCYGSYKFEGPGLFMESNIDPTDDWFRTLWSGLYRGIVRANVAIENISAMPNSVFPPSRKADLIAQAKFLRALLYSNLAIYYEDVPLILKSQTVAEASVPKNPFAEIRDSVIKDLTEAIVDLPISRPAAQRGYATRGAALGLLARFQLYNKNYSAVLAATEPMLTMGYGLFNNYLTLFTPAGEATNEIVFSVTFDENSAFNSTEVFSATFASAPRINVNPMRNLVNFYNCTDGRGITVSPLYNPANIKANRDPRFAASIYIVGDTFMVDLNRRFTGNTPTTFGQRKYIRNQPSATGIGVASGGGQDFYVIRYADVLLMRAEALAELNRPAEAYPLVNLVRARVRMPTVETVEGVGLTGPQMVEVIRRERRVELAFEGLRFFDLKRWGQVQQGFARAVADAVPGYLPVNRGRRSEVFPIPQAEIDVNKALVQNPVWE